ncbi:helix-turn-helix domain-containing protein [Vagococcus proximus]|uniref:helix-turn-helix domain-containing protein n=1 Tax=Vagococcus proximus TaxID=2991417 RepID=UPI00266D4E32|nr:helix-turn-helix domain-containing protein [Vagococcus proximus]
MHEYKKECTIPISYNNLWKLTIDKNLNKTQLRDKCGITSSTLARLSKNKDVSLENIPYTTM